MFEQATLTNDPGGKRAWTAFLGLTSQFALVSVAVLAPMVWPQVLPTARFLESLAPPLPPPAPRQLGETKRHPSNIRVVRNWRPGSLLAPVHIPAGPIPILVDEPTGPLVAGIPNGIGDPANVGVFSSLLQDVTANARVPMPRIPVPAPKAAAPEPTPVIPRLRVGGDVHLGALLHKAEPQYPPLAKAARVSGDVELECVVGVDGRIHQVTVKSGNPLLVHAAVDAAWQWVYAPSKLNSVPIEIVTILKFTFKLN
jgi:protein TonB